METRESVGEWADETFGPSQSRARDAERVLIEVAELSYLLWHRGRAGQKLELQAADVAICLMRMAHELKYNLGAELYPRPVVNPGRMEGGTT